VKGRAAHLVKGLCALAVLVALVAGVPWALWHFVGWPLPHHVPTAGEVGRALSHQGIPAQVLVDALAVVVWLAWGSLLASLAAEIPAALVGRQASRLPVAGVLQPLTGRLVAAVVVACITLTPRPAQATAQLSMRPGGLLAHRAMPALVVRDTVSTSTTHLSALRTTPSLVAADGVTPAGPPAAAAPAPASAVVAPRVYIVQRGDTLWGIAERELGDPLEWSKIYALNEGRPQPGGATLDDPHWIDPGWILLLPPTTAASAPPVPATSPAPSPAPTPSTGAPTTTAPTQRAPADTAPPRSPTPTVVPGSRDATSSGRSAHEPVRLPSGSVVGGSFAAGVLSAVALGRLRRRHTYRYLPPEPGLDLGERPLRLTLRLLARSSGEPDEAAGQPVGVATSARVAAPVTGRGASVGPDDTGCFAHSIEGRLRPGLLELGVRDGRSVMVEVTDLSGVALSGPVTDDIARALIAGLIVQAGPGAAEVLCATDLAERLLPGVGPAPAIRSAATALELARVLEVERVSRARRLDAAGAQDAASFREQHPENPLPVLLVLTDAPRGEAYGRWAGLCEGSGRLGIAVVCLADTAVGGSGVVGGARVVTDADRKVVDAEPERLGRMLVGAELFALGAGEAVDVLGAVFAAASEEGDHQGAARSEEDRDLARPAEGLAEVVRLGGSDATPQLAAPSAERWPEPGGRPDAHSSPIRVEVLGPLSITVGGAVVSTGLRSRARVLLAWYLCRPEGASAGQAVDALWPDTPPEGVLRQFWRALGDLRVALRGLGGVTPEVLEKTGEHYRAKPDEIGCDLWDFQVALSEAARAGDDDTARRALRRAVDAYRGDLLEGTDDLWAEPVRTDLHRRALDAHLRLAELDEHAGNVPAAVEVLERVIELDRYAEEPYRRLMALHARRGRPDALSATWKLLRQRLAELDLDVEAASVNLYRSLAPTERREGPRPASSRS